MIPIAISKRTGDPPNEMSAPQRALGVATFSGHRGTGGPAELSALKRICRITLPICLCVSALAQLRCDGNSGPNGPQRPRVEINGHVWRVELATTRFARYRGLSGRGSVDGDEGMLFVYPQPKVLGFCMRECRIPLDIAFIDADLTIVRIHTMAIEPPGATEATYKAYSSDVPAQYALEVRAGELGHAKVKVGQKVTFLGTPPNPIHAERGD